MKIKNCGDINIVIIDMSWKIVVLWCNVKVKGLAKEQGRIKTLNMIGVLRMYKTKH
jgi:predicted transport protein